MCCQGKSEVVGRKKMSGIVLLGLCVVTTARVNDLRGGSTMSVPLQRPSNSAILSKWEQQQRQQVEQENESDRSSNPLFDVLAQGMKYLGSSEDYDEFSDDMEFSTDESEALRWAAIRPRKPVHAVVPSNIMLPAMGITAAAALTPIIWENWRFFLSGSICCAISHGLAVPMDVLKTSIQLSPERFNKGVVNAFWTLLAEGGVGGMFRGLQATLVGYGLQGALKFGLYETFKPRFKGMGLPVLLATIVSSALAETVGSTALAPMEAKRIRKVMAGMGEATAAQETNMFSGLGCLLMKQIPYTITKLVTFEWLKATVHGALATQGGVLASHPSVKFAATMLCCICAGMLSAVASQPGDTLLSRSHAGHAHGHRDDDMIAASSSSSAEYDMQHSCSGGSGGGDDFGEGVRRRGRKTAAAAAASRPVRIAHGGAASESGFASLFCGLRARLLHVTVLVMIQLMIYDTIKGMLGIPPK